MSDFEDEMDVDAPAVQSDIKFSSDNVNTKGKRSAANLPVEAEDSLPWYVLSIGEYLAYEAHIFQGGEVSTKFTRRCRRTSRHTGNDKQICRSECMYGYLDNRSSY